MLGLVVVDSVPADGSLLVSLALVECEDLLLVLFIGFIAELPLPPPAVLLRLHLLIDLTVAEGLVVQDLNALDLDLVAFLDVVLQEDHAFFFSVEPLAGDFGVEVALLLV